MFDFFKRLKEEKTMVIFFPKSLNCCVYQTWRLLHLSHIRNVFKVLIDNRYINLTAAFSSRYDTKKVPKRKFVFAHGDIGTKGFLSINGSIKSDWFNNGPYDIGIFHSCDGYTILSDSTWNNVFNDWISYDVQLGHTSGVSEITNAWKRIFLQMIESTKQLSNTGALSNRFKSLYYEEMVKADSLTPGEGGELLKCDIQQAIDSLKQKS